MNVSSFVVLTTAGLVDVAASAAKFDSALATYIAERETETVKIGDAVNAVFDSHLGKTLTMPVLQSLATAQLNAQPENWKVLSDRVAQYARDNAGPDGTLKIAKGKGGGVSRRCDASAPAAQ